ncbi:MAG: choice-of-anchor D domain-containing protein [Verrucomicrobiota bacterium]
MKTNSLSQPAVMFGCRVGPFILASLFLCAATARANFCGSDRLESGTNWTSLPQSGNGQLLFQNNRAEYLLGNTTVRNNLDVHYWNVNTGSYTSNWSVQVDVHLALLSLPADGDAANLNLVITPNTQGSNGLSFSAAIDRYAFSDGSGPNYMADFGTFLDSVGMAEVADNATDATLKINFDSTQKTLTAYYNKGTGWIQIGQPVSIAGWSMASLDTFSVALVSNSMNSKLRDTAAAVASGDAYYKNFAISTVLNGDFEIGASAPWTNAMGTVPAPTAAAAHSGQYGLELTGMGPPALISQQIQTHLTAGTVYRFTGWINLLEVNPDIPLQMPRYLPHMGIYLGPNFSSFAVVANATNAVGQGWQKLEFFRSFTVAELESGVTLEVGGLARFRMDDVSATSELLANQSFDTTGGAGWSYEPLGVWAPFAIDGQVDLHRSYVNPPVKMLWQDLNVSNVGGATGTACMRLKTGVNPPPAGNATAVYLDYLDGASSPQRLLLLSPDNLTVAGGPDGSFFTANFTLPAGAQKVTGFSVDRTYGGYFYAMEFRLAITAAAPVVAPGVTLVSPSEANSFAIGETIPLVAEVDTSGGAAAVTGVDFYDYQTFIGHGQLSALGRWVFPDTSELAVMGNGISGMADYSPPSASGEQMYMMDGTFTSQGVFQGLFTHYNPDQVTGNVEIQLILPTNGTLDALISADAPLGGRFLTGGVNQNFPKYTLSWSGAAAGPHAVTARAYYGATYAASAPVNITVTGAATTRVIGISGNLAFGNVKVGSSANATMTVSNTGNAPLAVSSISYPAGFTGNWASGTIAAGSSQDVTVTFSPSAAQAYSGTITVNSDSTSGTSTIAASGQGTQTPYEAWQAGKFTAGEIAGGLSAPAADFDHDGVANLLEYAFHTNPKVADLTGVAPNVSGNKMQISFTCLTGRSDITYTVQSSPSLAAGSWTDIARSVGGATTVPINSSGCAVSDTGIDVRTVTVTEAAAFTGKRFLRVKVTSP